MNYNKLFLMLCAIALLGLFPACEPAPTNEAEPEPVEEQPVPESTLAPEELSRLRDLMAGFEPALVEEAVAPRPDEAGAQWGLKYKVPGTSIVALCYGYPHQDDHAEGIKLLEEAGIGKDQQVTTSSNGAILMYAMRNESGSEEQEIFSDLLSWFAGEE